MFYDKAPIINEQKTTSCFPNDPNSLQVVARETIHTPAPFFGIWGLDVTKHSEVSREYIRPSLKNASLQKKVFDIHARLCSCIV